MTTPAALITAFVGAAPLPETVWGEALPFAVLLEPLPVVVDPELDFAAAFALVNAISKIRKG